MDKIPRNPQEHWIRKQEHWIRNIGLGTLNIGTGNSKAVSRCPLVEALNLNRSVVEWIERLLLKW